MALHNVRNQPFQSFKRAACGLVLGLASVAAQAAPTEYQVDIEGAHAFVNFKFKHLGYSWLTGTFKDFDGKFVWDPEDVANSKIEVVLQTASLDSNHAERDKHIRDKRYLNVSKFPEASFVSTRITQLEDGMLEVTGDLTLHGVTKEITFPAEVIGEGPDPWGGYRAGFAGEYVLDTTEFGMENFRPLNKIWLELLIEGKRKS